MAAYTLPAPAIESLEGVGLNIADSLFGMLVGISLALVALFVIRWAIRFFASMALFGGVFPDAKPVDRFSAALGNADNQINNKMDRSFYRH